MNVLLVSTANGKGVAHDNESDKDVYMNMLSAENEEQAGSMEAAVGLNENVTIYQMTKKGLALQITLQGTKYWQDGDLN